MRIHLPIGWFFSLRATGLWFLRVTISAVVGLLTFGTLRAAEPPSAPVLRIEAEMHTAEISGTSVDASGRLVLSSSLDKTGRLWELPSGRLLRVLRPPIEVNEDGGFGGRLGSCALTKDGTIAAVGQAVMGDHGDDAKIPKTYHTSVFLFDATSGRLVKRLPVEAWVEKLAFSPDGKFLAGKMVFGMVRVWEVATGLEIFHDDYTDSAWGEVSWYGDRLLNVTGEQLRLYRVHGGKITLLASRKRPKETASFGDAQFSPDGNQIAVAQEDGDVAVLDGNTLAKLFAPKGGAAGFKRVYVQWTQNGSELAVHMCKEYSFKGVVTHKCVMRRWGAGGRGNPVDSGCEFEGAIQREVLEKQKFGGFLHSEWLEKQRLSAQWSSSSEIRQGIEHIFSPGNGKLENHPAIPVALDFSDPVDVRIKDKRLKDRGLMTLGLGWNWDKTLRFYLLKKRANPREPNPPIYLLTFFAHADGKRWVLWTPEGFYDCAPGAEDLIGFYVNRGKDEAANFFPASRFRNIYYRPDVVKRVLETLDVPEALRQANRALGRPDAQPKQMVDVIARLAPPVVELETGGMFGTLTLPADATGAKLRYSVRQTGLEAPSKVSVRFNGRLVDVAAPLPTEGTTAEVTVPLPAGMAGEVSIFAEHRLATSEAALLRIERQPGKVVPRQASLFLVSAGVSHFKMNEPTTARGGRKAAKEGDLELPELGHAAEDAQQFAESFRAQEGRLYRRVISRTLRDGAAGTAALREALREVAREAQPEDVAVIFFAGHGVVDAAAGFYLATYDADPKAPAATALMGTELSTLLEGIKARTVLALDTCHSGGALGGAWLNRIVTGPGDLTGFVNTLSSAEQGTVVFSSSGAKEQSFEDEEKGGLFTVAFREGLTSKSGAGGDRAVNCRGMQDWLTKRVPELVAALTKGAPDAPRQTPVCVIPKGVPDFPLAKP